MPSFRPSVRLRTLALLALPVAVAGAALPTSAPAQSVVSVTPQQVQDDFRRDPEAAKQKYIGQVIRVQGVVNSVDDKSALFKIGNYEMAVQCLFDESERAQLRQLKEGSVYTLEGTGTNQLGAKAVRLTRCHVPGGAPAKPVAVETGPADPPLGKYACMGAAGISGYVTLAAGGAYGIDNGPGGKYTYDRATRGVRFVSGRYAQWGWSARYEYQAAATLGRPQDESVLRVTDGKSLKMGCYLMRS